MFSFNQKPGGESAVSGANERRPVEPPLIFSEATTTFMADPRRRGRVHLVGGICFECQGTFCPISVPSGVTQPLKWEIKALA